MSKKCSRRCFEIDCWHHHRSFDLDLIAVASPCFEPAEIGKVMGRYRWTKPCADDTLFQLIFKRSVWITIGLLLS